MPASYLVPFGGLVSETDLEDYFLLHVMDTCIPILFYSRINWTITTEPAYETHQVIATCVHTIGEASFRIFGKIALKDD